MRYEDLTYSQKQDREQARRMAVVADDYRGKYLLLRKMIREYIEDNDLAAPTHIKKAIGLK